MYSMPKKRPDNQTLIQKILHEEVTLFLAERHHMPMGREEEDIIDNTLTRAWKIDGDITYTDIENMYTKLMMH